MTAAPRSPARRRLVSVLAVAALLLLAVPTVRAEDILEISGPITDTTGALEGREDDIVAAIDRTLDEHGIQAFVVFVQTTQDRTAEEYAFETADTNSLGVDDVLILVALDDRTDYIWLSDGLESISTDELDAIITGTLEPGLRDGDFADATIATIEALGEAATASAPTDAPATPTPTDTDAGSGGSDGSGDDGGIGLGTIVAVALIGGGGFLVWRQWRKRSAAGGGPAAAPGEAPVDVEALGHEATALLIATDERIRDAAQEVDFAEAQYGPDEVVGLREAVAAARDELTAAFTVRQRLDDEVPEDEPTRIAMLREIVERTTRAQDRLDAETDRIRALRDLERDAPRTLVELPGRIEAVEDRLPAAGATLERLGAYAPTAWEPVAGNLEEARKGLAGARDAVIIGSAAASDEDRSRIAVATRQALEGLTGAATLLDAIDALAAAIADADRRLPGELQAATTDLADAEAAVAGRTPTPEAEERRRAAERALLAARAAADARPTDPVEALRLATEAHRAADEALLAARDAAAAADRIVAAADASLRTAAAEVDRTASFIASRRRGVGDTARTRFAEAQRHLQLAAGLAASDPAGTLEEARRAETLAREAYDLARDDFTDWDQGGPGWGQRSGSGGDQTAEILGQILGGVVGGVLAGGGRRGGGWGGSPWGGGGGGGGIPDIGGALGGGWGGGGGFGSGGFGGGGGGGGGRGRGGRW